MGFRDSLLCLLLLQGVSLVQSSADRRTSILEERSVECSKAISLVKQSTFVGSDDLCALGGAHIASSTQGVQNVGSLYRGNWVAFAVATPKAAVYDVSVKVASAVGEGSFEISNMDTGEVYRAIEEIASTGGWHNWETVKIGQIALPEGETNLQITSTEGGWNLLSIEFASHEPPESFDYMVYNSDIRRDNGEKLSEQNMAHTYNGDDLAFDLTVDQPGRYAMYAKTSNPANLGSFAIINRQTSQLYAIVNPIPATDGWDETTTFFVGELLLSAGTHPLDLLIIQGQWHLDYFGVTLLQATEASVRSGPDHMVQAHDFSASKGMELDMAHQNLGNLDAGDWVEYNLNIEEAGSYIFHFFVASPNGGGSFQIVNVQTLDFYGETPLFPSTGGWFDWVPVSVTGVNLDGGDVTLRLSVTSGGFNLFGLSYERSTEGVNDDVDDNGQNGDDHDDGREANGESETDEEGASSVGSCGSSAAVQNVLTTEGVTTTISADQLCAIEGAALEPSSEGGQHIGYLQDGHWVAFDVSLVEPALFDVRVRLSSPSGEGSFSISNMQTGTIYTTVESVVQTDGWQNWQEIDVGVISLPAMPSTLQVTSNHGGWNLKSIELTAKELEGGEEGGEDVPAPESFLYMVYDSDITREDGEKLSEQSMAHTYSGEELTFDLKVDQSGRYAMYAKISNPSDLGSFAVINRETSQLHAIANGVPDTDGWDKTKAFFVGELMLPAGTNPLALLVIEGQWHLDYFGVILLEPGNVGSPPNRYMIQASSFTASEGTEVDGVHNNLGKLDFVDWVEYRLSIKKSGNYMFHFLIASPNGFGSFQIVDAQTLEIYGSASSFPSTGDWFVWESVDVPNIGLREGDVTLRLTITKGGFNLFGISYELAE